MTDQKLTVVYAAAYDGVAAEGADPDAVEQRPTAWG
jgi:hypothetical protein